MKQKRTILTKMEQAFVAAHTGNDTQAARAAGFKNPSVTGHRLMKLKRVSDALAEKNSAMNRELGRREGKRLSKVYITRNDIINILAEVGLNGKSESARVAAAMGLADIFRLRPKNANDTEDFTGWTDNELLAWAQRGEYPARLRRKSQSSEGEENIPQSSKGPVN